MTKLRYCQSCPICGRWMLIPIAHLGHDVSCSHCGGNFQATDRSSDRGDSKRKQRSVMDRADALLMQDDEQYLDTGQWDRTRRVNESLAVNSRGERRGLPPSPSRHAPYD